MKLTDIDTSDTATYILPQARSINHKLTFILIHLIFLNSHGKCSMSDKCSYQYTYDSQYLHSSAHPQASVNTHAHKYRNYYYYYYTHTHTLSLSPVGTHLANVKGRCRKEQADQGWNCRSHLCQSEWVMLAKYKG